MGAPGLQGTPWRVEWAARAEQRSSPDARFKANVVSGTAEFSEKTVLWGNLS